jgi:D-alanyl-D-alanine carboxypeptidase
LVFSAAAVWLSTRSDESAATPAPLPATLQAKLDGIVSNPHAAPGAVAAVLTPGGVRLGAAGLAELPGRRPMRPDDRVRIASITKTYTAALVLQLVGEGRLALDDTVGHRLSGVFPADKRGISVRQLLSHASGLEDVFNTVAPEYTADPRAFLATLPDRALRHRVEAAAARLRADPESRLSPHLWVEVAAARPLDFPPGTDNRYSNTNYAVLGEIVERITGRGLGAVMHDRLFAPLGLDDTFYVPGPDLPAPFAHAYAPASADGIPREDVTRVTLGISGASSVVADADDVTRFFAALLSGRVLPPRLLQVMLTEQMGIGTMPLSCGVAYGHDGGFGFASWARASRDGTRVAVLVVNGRGRDTGTAGAEVLDDLFCSSLSFAE